jgi:hypothetical protein
MAKAISTRGGSRAESKSQAIRDMIRQHPRAKASEIVRLLGDHGVHVQPTLVYYIRSRARNKRRARKQQEAMDATKKTVTIDPVKFILKVRELATEAGGVKQLKQVVDAMAH